MGEIPVVSATMLCHKHAALAISPAPSFSADYNLIIR